MGQVIRLHDRHQECEKLLPWYVTGQLDPVDRAQVEAHLGNCVDCQAELVSERELRAQVANLPLDNGPGWMEMRRRRDVTPPMSAAALRSKAAIWRVLSRPGGMGWIAAAQAAALVLIATTVLPPLSRPAPYHTLGSVPTAATGNVIVIFRPDASERALRRTLNASGARLVDGPTAAGAYVLHVPAAARALAMQKLRGQHDVVLAQPIDANPQP